MELKNFRNIKVVWITFFSMYFNYIFSSKINVTKPMCGVYCECMPENDVNYSHSIVHFSVHKCLSVTCIYQCYYRPPRGGRLCLWCCE